MQYDRDTYHHILLFESTNNNKTINKAFIGISAAFRDKKEVTDKEDIFRQEKQPKNGQSMGFQKRHGTVTLVLQVGKRIIAFEIFEISMRAKTQPKLVSYIR